jgi:hypothetical protein
VKMAIRIFGWIGWIMDMPMLKWMAYCAAISGWMLKMANPNECKPANKWPKTKV